MDLGLFLGLFHAFGPILRVYLRVYLLVPSVVVSFCCCLSAVGRPGGYKTSVSFIEKKILAINPCNQE